MYPVMKRLGKRMDYTTLMFVQAYFLSHAGADIGRGKPLGFTYSLDIGFAGAATVMWIIALLGRLDRCGLNRWWSVSYCVIFLAGGLMVVLKKLNATEIAVAVITWIVLQIPLLVFRDKPEPPAD